MTWEAPGHPVSLLAADFTRMAVETHVTSTLAIYSQHDGNAFVLSAFDFSVHLSLALTLTGDTFCAYNCRVMEKKI